MSAGVVKQRLRLGAVSPKLLQVYREDGLTLDQLMAFGIAEDHARQADAYVEAGGTIIRDLFSADRGGFFEDAGLLDMRAIEKLREIAGEVQAEGWKRRRRISTIHPPTRCGASIRRPFLCPTTD